MVADPISMRKGYLTPFLLFTNNIHNGDILTITFNGEIITKTFDTVEGNTVTPNGMNRTSYGSYQFPVIRNLTPNTDYPYSLKIQRANLYAIKTGVFRTASQ